MEWHTGWKALIILWVVWWRITAASSKHRKGYGGTSSYHHYRGDGYSHHYDYSSTYNPKNNRDECMSQLLTCVPEEDCTTYTDGGYMEGHECPVNFISHAGLCVFVAHKERVYDRTQTQVVEYCGRLGTRPYYFQSTEEWNDFKKIAEKGYIYWLDAHWEENRDRWEWRSTHELIQWEKILSGTKCYKDNKRVVDEEDDCLGVELDEVNGCLRLLQMSCLVTNPFMCKAGEYKSRCVENTESVCCFSPTYDYYNHNRDGPAGSHGVHGATKSQCWVLLHHYHHTHVGQKLVDCHEALDAIGNLSPFPQPVRIGTSYYYFSDGKGCLGERQAVISSREVHDFIVRYLMTEEMKGDRKFIIGLKYDTEEDKFHWENGKTAEYYDNETYWADGQPDKRGDIDDYSCVAYKKTNINAYSWHLLTSQACLGKYAVNVCELPIRSTNIIPTEKKVECGQRLERGALARASYYDYHDDDEQYHEAQYGEFPWHVAVLEQKLSQGGVVMVFACSGALIHPKFVLTSAHCALYTGSGDFTVSLGDWDLGENAKHLLNTKVVTVADVIIHPGYRSSDSVLHDVALLHLEEVVDVDEYPHVGLACLPSPSLFYQSTGAWECFTLGWPQDRHHKGDRRILQRIVTEFVPRRKCRYETRTYYKALNQQKVPYGYHDEYDDHYGFFDVRNPELICAKPYEYYSCLDDPTPILVCRKASFYTDDPFNLGHYDYDYRHEKEHRTYGGSKTNKFYFSSSRIINAYGEDRFDSDMWYIMGIGHNLNSCDEHDKHDKYNRYDPKYDRHHRRRPHRRHDSSQLFTAVHEYVSFIHSHLDIHE